MIPKTDRERVVRDLDVQRLVQEFVIDAPKIKVGWVMVSPAASKRIFMKILKMYPETRGLGQFNEKANN